MVPPCSDRVTRVPPYSISRRDGFRVRGYHPLWRHFPEASASHSRRFWAVPVSLIATRGISVDFFSSGYLDISVPRVRLVHLCIQCTIANKLAGFPHSDIPGSKSVCRLPEAYRRLRRPSSPSAAKAFTRCACSLDHITQPVGWATWNVFRRYFFTRGRRPRCAKPAPKGVGEADCGRRHSRRFPCHRGRRQMFVAKTHSFTDGNGCRSAGRESLPEGPIGPSPQRRFGCVSRLSKTAPKGTLELADTRLHQLRNFETARRQPSDGSPSFRPLTRSMPWRAGSNFVSLSSVSAPFWFLCT